MKDLLKSYSKRLTNLSGKNRSLLLLKLYSHQYIDLREFDFLNMEPSFNILQKLIEGKSHVLSPEFDSRDDDVNIVSRKLKKLIRTEKFLFEEQGTKDLHIGWPFIRGKFSDGTQVRCALLYIPVEIILSKNQYVIKQRKDIGISLNKSFLLAYGHFNEVKIPDEVLDFNIDEFDTDITVFRTSLYQFLKEASLEINFNRDNFMDQLSRFEEFKKDDFEKNEKNGELKLFPEAVLGIFPQSGSNLVPDYEKLMEMDSFDDLDDFFQNRSLSEEEVKQHSEYYYLGQLSEEKTFTPFETDAYQENAIKAIKQGYSIVVQGPPGTGKSQLICNLISDFIARGKNVLVISQKRAALDVVYKRLSEKNIQEFTGLVHDFKNDRKVLYEKIAKQIRLIPEYQGANNSLGLVQLERRFLQTSRKIDQLKEVLDEFKKAIFDTSEFGISIKELYLKSNPNEKTLNFRMEFQHFKMDDLPDFLIKLRSYCAYGTKFNKPEYPLFERHSFSGYGILELKKLEEILDEIPGFQEKITTKTHELFGQSIDVEDAEMIFEKKNKITEMITILKDSKIFEYFRHMLSYPDQLTDNLWLGNTERVLMECYKGHGPEMSLPSDKLGKFQEVLGRVFEARKRLFKLLKWKLFSEDKFLLKRVLISNQLTNDKKGLQILVEKIDNRLNLEHNISKLKETGWLKDLPTSYEKINFQNWFHEQKLAVKARVIFSSLRQHQDLFLNSDLKYDDLKNKFETLFQLIHEIPERRIIWEMYFSKTQVSNLLKNKSLAERIKTTLQSDFDSLCEFDSLKGHLKDHEKAVLENLINSFDNLGTVNSEKLFLNSLYIAWINHIESKYPILRSVSSMKFKTLEAELQNAVSEKLGISNEILLLKLKEQTYEDIEYNRLNNRVTYRELGHQVNKKKRIWPLRKLLQEHSNEVFNLLPCWMASPESVSAIFPMQNLFDLVIFDEAS
ncbi:MAG: AAA domain-containing protein [Cyclobacteriaceae bacterium]|nr:AAA domain-containing protein [Cyclobacteriaceae bacterium]